MDKGEISAVNTEQVTIALLGAGYTLRRVAQLLDKEKIVLTCVTEENFQALRDEGYFVERLKSESVEEIGTFLKKYPNLETVVDSIPPQPGTASGIPESINEFGGALKRIIYLSTTGVYGVDDGEVVTEDAPLNPIHERAKLRVVVEKGYRSLVIPSCSFRIAAIYGPGRGIGHSLRAGRYPLIDGGGRWSNRIHVDDLAAAIVAAVSHQGLLPLAINLADDYPARSAEVVEFYCKQFGFAAPSGLTLEEARERGLDTMLSNQRISNQLLKKFLLPELRYPSFREGAASEFS